MMKPTEFFKIAAIAVLTSGMVVGCQQSSTDDMSGMADEDCQAASPDVRNAIYAAKLKNARARNLGADWEENAKLIAEAEQAVVDCEHVRAKILANKAEDAAANAIATKPTDSEMGGKEESPYIGGYLVVSGDSLWSISGQESVYGNPFQWPLIYKANSDHIKDADLIPPGQYFSIPKVKGHDRAAAIAHAKNRGAWTLGEVEASDLDYLSQ